MKIWKYLKKNHIFLNAELPDKDAVFRFIVKICKKVQELEEQQLVINKLETGYALSLPCEP